MNRAPLASLAAALLTLAVPRSALADEPVAASEPRLLSETAEITSVVDAFDDDDPFDLHLALGLQQRWKTANIRRETSLAQPGLSTGGFVAGTENVASYSQARTVLHLQADVGLYKDLAFILRLPVILADSRELASLDGSTRNPQRLQDPAGNTLFSLPFKSPTRSGIDYIALGLNYAIFNQQRTPHRPTWVIGIEGQFGVGTPLHACTENPAGTSAKCPDPAAPTQNRDAGVSRAVTAIAFKTVFSRRMGYVEPYSGFDFLAEFPQDRGDWSNTSGLAGVLLSRPPMVGTVTMGLEVIPWEDPAKFQRIVADFRLQGSYYSPGNDYTELFDALGTSQAPTLRSANPGSYMLAPGGGSSVADPTSQKVYFAGITNQGGHGAFAARTGFTWQPGEYLKFAAGLGVTFVQSHTITGADACNPDVPKSLGSQGPCQGSQNAVPNPAHRPVIDLPGRRFIADDTRLVDLWLSGTVMF